MTEFRTGNRQHDSERNPLRRLHTDERGEHALEVLMILAFGVLPMISAVWLLEDVIREYVAYGQIFITSPFF